MYSARSSSNFTMASYLCDWLFQLANTVISHVIVFLIILFVACWTHDLSCYGNLVFAWLVSATQVCTSVVVWLLADMYHQCISDPQLLNCILLSSRLCRFSETCYPETLKAIKHKDILNIWELINHHCFQNFFYSIHKGVRLKQNVENFILKVSLTACFKVLLLHTQINKTDRL